MTPFDLVVANGRIVDGTGNPWFSGDLGIRGKRIAEIARAGTLRGRRRIDAADRYVTPGFVDIHTHSDLSLLVNRRAESMVRQGVTTQLIGNCGMAAAPVAEERLSELRHDWGRLADAPGVDWSWRTFAQYLQTLQQAGLGTNVAALAGHGALRIAAMGFAERPPTDDELQRMSVLLEEAMQAGAWGLSTGLVYPPGCFASTDELVALAQVAAGYGGFYASHIRGERETILEAVAEAIEIGERAGLPVQISHNAPKYGAPCDASANLALVEQARARGLDVTVDNDVHTDFGPTLVDTLPQHVQEKEPHEIAALLRDREGRRRIRQEIVDDRRPAFGPAGLLVHGRWERITLLLAPNSPDDVGQTMAQIARRRGQDPFDAYLDLIVENGDQALAIFDYIDEVNIRILLLHPLVMICSDGGVSAPYGFLGEPMDYCPCSYGEFPGVLERYVRDEPLLTLQEAVRKMTSFPAQRLGLWDRGVLRPQASADLVLFDLDRVRDRATGRYPHDYPEGIDYVVVNGTVVVEEGEHTGALPGELLRRP